MSELDFDQLVLEEITCAQCGIRFGVIKPLLERRRKDHLGFYCPNGHCNAYLAPAPTRDEELEATHATAETARQHLREAKDEIARLTSENDQYRAGLHWWQRR